MPLSGAQESIDIATGEWPPYTSASLPQDGYVNHVVRSAFGEMGIQVSFIYQPWARSYEGAKKGDYAATSYWYQDPKHQADFLLSTPLTKEKVVFFRRKSGRPLHWDELADFDDLRIGLSRSYTYTQALWEYANANPHRISVVNTDTQNIKMLLLERIDLFPVQELVGWNLVHGLFAPEQANRIETLQPPLSEKTGHLLFPKRNAGSERWRDLFNRGLDKLKKKGLLEQYREDLIMGGYARPGEDE
ncbi:ABC transporter substrate-binding protein [Lacimicrobium alkaliphilum]|uniref:ABC transporter substrate-binding protein n=2 Tax=Lacimicrobium alkaliphilum TaxID=1526571 RepID=A0ABQ1RJ01_9ALTE|nr:ABC transporter substrate-binding protein [Lacimicrobium alkaliphilum]